MFCAVALASAVALGSTAVMAATQVSITAISDLTDYEAAVAGSIAREDFEVFGGINGGSDAKGIVWDDSWVTSVGKFRTFGLATGSGSVCRQQSGSPCGDLFLAKDPSESGQGNTVPDNGIWALSSNDTEGMIWDAYDPNGGSFNFLAFVLQDVADQSNTILTVSADGASQSVSSRLGDANKQLVSIFFADGPVTGVEVSIFNEGRRVNDGFTFDGGALALRSTTDIGQVPLPAPALLLLGGIAGLGALRGLKRRAA
jgi:hypothetical protein